MCTSKSHYAPVTKKERNLVASVHSAKLGFNMRLNRFQTDGKNVRLEHSEDVSHINKGEACITEDSNRRRA